MLGVHQLTQLPLSNVQNPEGADRREVPLSLLSVYHFDTVEGLHPDIMHTAALYIHNLLDLITKGARFGDNVIE
jgi:hypothetical protein